jgi:hypothetical protein
MIAQALDASLLDADLHSLLKEQLRNGLKWLNPTLIEDISPDFRAIVKSIIYYYLVWPSSRSATYSQRLLGLRYSQTGRGR